MPATSRGATRQLSAARRALLERQLRGELRAAPAIARRDGAGPAPLSYGQEQIWFLSQLAPGSPVYNESLAVHCPAGIDPGALERAFNEVLRRHEAWRTVVRTREGRPEQVVLPATAHRLPVIDLGHLPPDRRAAEAVRLAEEDARRPFDLEQGPLWRAMLLSLGEDGYRLHLTLRHLVFDGVSIYQVLLPELRALHDAYRTGAPSPLPEPPVQYADYAVWQREWARGPVAAAQLDHWRARLAGLPELQLATDHPRPPVQSFRGACRPVAVPRRLTDDLKALSRGEGVTLFMAVLAAFQVVLLRWTGQDDLVVGTITTGRELRELEGLLGYFLNPVVLRADLSGEPTFRQVLRRARDVTLAAFANDDLPFELLVRELRPQRDLSRNPLFQVLLTLEPPVPQGPPGWDLVTQMGIDNGTSKFDLSVELDDRPEGLVGRFIYSTDLFDAGTVERMVRHFLALLEAAVAAPDRPVTRLPVLGAEEAGRLDACRGAGRPIPDLCVHELVRRQAAATPDAVAVEHEGRRLTYRELTERARRLAHRLRALGARPDVPVAVCLERGVDLVVAALGVLESGAAYLPLDPAHPAGRLAHVLDDSAAAAVVTCSRLLGRLPAGTPRALLLDGPDESPGEAVPASRPVPGHLAYMIYTSGSTGRPKGVAVSHRGVVNVVRAFAGALGAGPDDVLVAVTTPSFDIAVLELLLPLATGGRVVVGGSRAAADPEELAALVARSRATLLQATPSTWRLLLESGWRGAPGLRALSGGEPLPRDLADGLLERCHSVWNGYGPTEATIYATLARVEPAGRVTIGRPVDNLSAHVVDRWGNRLPPGVPGELWIGGPGVARGYAGRPDLTAERFVPDPFGEGRGERLYRTGDLVRLLPAGELEHLGRIDQQVKVRGHRVEPAEVEAALLRHPGVREAVVVARDVATGDRRLVAYVVSAGPATGADELRPWLRRLLPDHLVPSAYVAMERLPRTLSGKLDRAALPAPGGRGPGAHGAVPPRSRLEGELADIWAGVLGVERVGARDDFFALGGHSLLAVRAMAEVERRFGRSLPVAAIFQEGSTVAGLAALLEAPERPAPPVSPLLSPVRPAGSLPPLFVVEPDRRGLVALRHFLPFLDPEQPVLALLPRTSEGRFDRDGSVDHLAGELLAVLRASQPQGPYRLAGYSFGGVLAYELAGRLREAGEQVDFLALIDTMAPELALRHSEPFMTMRTRVRRLLLSPPARWPAMLWGAARRVAGRPIRTAAGPDEFDADGAVALLGGYRIRPCDVPVTVFSSSWQRRWSRDPALGWRGVHAGPLAAQVVPGDHRTMLLQPQVNDLAVRFARRLRAARPGRPGHPWRISLVIPARNEAANLPHVLPRIPRAVDEVILVDGGSTDGTARVARELWPGIRTLAQEGSGKGDALRQGFEAATGDIVVAMDADGSTDPAEIPLYVGALTGGADFVRGSRYLQGGGSADLSLLRSLGNRALVTLVRLLFRNSFSDLCYGYMAFWRRLLPALQLDAVGFEIEAQLSVRALARGLTVYEVPSFERVRIAGRSSLRPFPDGLRVLRTVLAERVHRQVRPPAEPSLELPGQHFG
ncbi:MAG TPA: amino acid adenylation domain-containing protein [Candidatus Dormibacteraeota bacterium]